MAVLVGPGRTIEARTPVPSSSICIWRPSPPGRPWPRCRRPCAAAAAPRSRNRRRRNRRDGARSCPGTTAVASRWAPIRCTCTCLRNRRCRCRGPCRSRCRRHRTPAISVAPSSSVAVTNSLTESVSVTSRSSATASPPAPRILSTISSHFSTRRAPSATGWPRRQARTRWRHRCPTTRRRRSPAAGRVAVRIAAFSGPPLCMGRAANPRTLVEWTRSALDSSTSYPRIRLNNSVSATLVSSRARCAPRQKCAPPPKLISFGRFAADVVVVGVVEHPLVAVGRAGSSSSMSPAGMVVS